MPLPYVQYFADFSYQNPSADTKYQFRDFNLGEEVPPLLLVDTMQTPHPLYNEKIRENI